jgi:dihydroxy-acid dehydratase
MVMGTASTMACLAEALGVSLPGTATPISGSGRRLRAGVASGRRAVQLARTGYAASQYLTAASFRNAVKVLLALGGSTNAVIHLLAIARRAGIALTLSDIAALCDSVPMLVDVKPVGTRFLGDLDDAGGLPLLMRALSPLLELDAGTVSGRTWAELLADQTQLPDWQDVVRPLDAPLKPGRSLTVLYGSLAPEGAVIKSGAADPRLLRHRGPALVFNSAAEAEQALNDTGLDVTPDHVLVLRNIGPVAAGMPEAGSMPIPVRLARAGVKDMVRVSDGRMSGTAYGTNVLHCSPEAAVGGPLALVRDGDMIEIDVSEGRLDLLVDAGELGRRKPAVSPGQLGGNRWKQLYARYVTQAHEGADLRILPAG